MGKPYIVLGNKTSHGGVVIGASSTATVNGRGIARVGDKVTCPMKGHGEVTTIITGDPDATIDGKAPARQGDKTACGATLMASQGQAVDMDSVASGSSFPSIGSASRISAIKVAAAWQTEGSRGQTVQSAPEESGVVAPIKIEKKIFPNISQGKLKAVNAIVLHRTGGGTAQSTLHAYVNAKVGAHFLIDRDGTVYQTLETTDKGAHVGKLRPRCLVEGSGSLEERNAAAAIRDDPNEKSFSRKVSELHRLEIKKPYPDRYPSNDDSIGIEVVGRFLTSVDEFEPATEKQKAALSLLISRLMQEHSLAATDLYKHYEISYKSGKEGEGLGY